MASLMEELVDVLQEEKSAYEDLLALNDSKRDAIVHNKVDRLNEITASEEVISSRIKNQENQRVRILDDMAVVLGHDGQMMTVGQVIDSLVNQPEEQEKLQTARDQLVEVAHRVQFMNQQNQILLQQALEMVEFDLTLFKSMKQAPETANYNRSAVGTGDRLGSGSFDFKQ